MQIFLYLPVSSASFHIWSFPSNPWSTLLVRPLSLSIWFLLPIPSMNQPHSTQASSHSALHLSGSSNQSPGPINPSCNFFYFLFLSPQSHQIPTSSISFVLVCFLSFFLIFFFILVRQTLPHSPSCCLLAKEKLSAWETWLVTLYNNWSGRLVEENWKSRNCNSSHKCNKKRESDRQRRSNGVFLTI